MVYHRMLKNTFFYFKHTILTCGATCFKIKRDGSIAKYFFTRLEEIIYRESINISNKPMQPGSSFGILPLRKDVFTCIRFCFSS